MADRVQVNQNLGFNSPLRPTASPTDPYYQVKANTVQLQGGGDFADLANSVGIATPQIQKALSEEQKFQQEQAIAAGAKARLVNQKSFKDAQAAGLIRPAENPWFVKGYLQQDGRLSGMNYDAALRTAWAESSAKNSDNPADFQKFQNDFRTKWISENDGKTPDWMDGFAPKMAQADNNLSAQHVAYRQRVIEETAKQNTGIETRKLLDLQSEREAGLSPNDPLVLEGRRQTAAQIQALTADFVKKGLDGKTANQIVAEQVITKGIEMMDDGYARAVLGEIKTPGGSVSKIAEVAKQIASSELTIRDKVWSDKIHGEHDEDRPYAVAQRDFGLKQIEHTQGQWDKEKLSYDRSERVRARTNEMTMKVLSGKPLTEQEYLDLAKDDAGAAAWVKNFRHSLIQQNSQIINDPHAIAQTMLQMSGDPNSVSAKDIFGGVMANRWDMGAAMTMWNERQQLTGPGQDPANKDPYFQSLQHGLVSGIGNNVANLSGSAPFDASNAAVEFRKYYVELQADQTLKPSDRMAKLRSRQLELLKHYNEYAVQSSVSAKDAGVAPSTSIRGETKPTSGQKAEGPLQVPPSAVEYLMAHPETQADFERTFRLPKGAAARILNPSRGVTPEPQ